MLLSSVKMRIFRRLLKRASGGASITQVKSAWLPNGSSWWKIANEFESLFVEKAKSIRVGDPMDPAIQMGPMARVDLRDSLHKQVEGSIAKGARVLCGGKPVEGKGAFYTPTVLSGVTLGMPAFDDETFGPVAAITRVPDLDAAVKAANANQFGLSGN